MPRIVVLLNEETSFELTRFPAVLGRSPDCDIQVDNAQVSRRHAQIL